MLKIIYLSIYFLITQIVPAIGTSWNNFDPTYLFVQKIIFMLLAILFFKKELIESLKIVKLRRAAYTVLITFVVMLFTYIIIASILNTEVVFARYDWKILFFVESIFLGPFIEEIAYRYCFINSDLRYLKIVMASISSIIFAFNHAAAANYNLIFLIPFLVLGIILSIFYIVGKNIWYSILAHSFFNFMIFITPLLISN